MQEVPPLYTLEMPSLWEVVPVIAAIIDLDLFEVMVKCGRVWEGHVLTNTLLS